MTGAGKSRVSDPAYLAAGKPLSGFGGQNHGGLLRESTLQIDPGYGRGWGTVKSRVNDPAYLATN